MDKFIEDLLEKGLGELVDRSRDEILALDQIYQEDCRREEEEERKVRKLDLTKEQEAVINEYLKCAQISSHRCADISYIAGITDTVKFLVALGLLKGCDSEK